MDKERTNTTQL